MKPSADSAIGAAGLQRAEFLQLKVNILHGNLDAPSADSEALVSFRSTCVQNFHPKVQKALNTFLSQLI
jgi:hypothetical protein